jgi:hypothetical protein
MPLCSGVVAERTCPALHVLTAPLTPWKLILATTKYFVPTLGNPIQHDGEDELDHV